MSAKILLSLAFVFAAVVFVLVFRLRSLRNELRMTKCQLEATEKEKKAFAEQAARLSNVIDVTNTNRKEADEKIDALHSGDAAGNALDGLSKR